MDLMNKCLSLLALAVITICQSNAQPTSFHDDFSGSSLSAEWLINPGIGTYSLTAHPGFLRYALTTSTHNLPESSILWVYRPFSGTQWTLETRVTYALPFGNGRQFYFRVPLGSISQMRINEALVYRTSDQAGGGPAEGQIYTVFYEGGVAYAAGPFPTNPADTYSFRIERQGQTVRILMSPDGATWTELAERTYATALGATQHVMISSGNFAGSGYADHDYVSLTPQREVNCVGFEPPMDQGPVQVKQNRALPLKAQLFEEGIPLTDAQITPPVVEVLFDPGSGSDPIVVETLPVGSATEGNQFVYADGKWQFNLSTKPYVAPGTYYVSMKPGSADYHISPTCTTQFVKR